MQAIAAVHTDTDKQTAILQATLDLVAERGFHQTPMSLIAKRSGVSAGIIYHYFTNKEALIHQLYRRIKAQLSAALMAGEPQQFPWPDHLRQIWLNAYRFYVSHPQETAYLEQYENSPYYQEWDYIAEDEHYAALAALIMADFGQGVIKEMPIEVLYELTLGVAVGLAKREIAGSLQLDDETLAWAADACCRAIQA
jgi:AcrR family transcriptional regulator